MRARRGLAAILAAGVAVWLSLGAPAGAEVTGPTTRLAGPDRVATAVAVSQWRWADGAASVVVLARSDVPADALAATPLAVDAGPVLLSPVEELPAATAEEIERVLQPDAVVVLVGGTAALSSTVESQVQGLGVATRRLDGANRFATAVRIAQDRADPDASAGEQSIWLADGSTFADALLAGSWLGQGTTSAVLLTDGERMPAETRDMIVDGEFPASSLGTVGAAASAAARDGGVIVEQEVVGADVYETSRLLADFPSEPRAAALASGEDFADALAGGADAATLGIPLLLSTRDELPATVAEWFDEHTLDALLVYGGTDAISDAAVARAEGS